MKYPVLQHSNTPSLHSSRGFTLIEVVVALLITSIAVGVAAVSLTTSLHAEETAIRLQEAGLVAGTIACARYLDIPSEELRAGSTVWEAVVTEVEVDAEEPQIWHLVEFSPIGVPSASFAISFRVE